MKADVHALPKHFLLLGREYKIGGEGLQYLLQQYIYDIFMQWKN